MDPHAAQTSGLEAVFAAGGKMGALMRELDWSATPFGPAEDWPQSLRSSLSICLASEFPMIIFWGPHLAQVYNDAYLPVLGAKHPASLGQAARECWHEAWTVIGPMLEQVLYQGKATYSTDLLLILQRSGFAEECYFTFSYSPIRAESGGIGGVFCAVTETTERVVTERRLALIRELGERARSATTAAEACARAAGVLSGHPADVPFALLYLLDGDRARLAGTAGLPPGGRLSPREVDLAAGAAAEADVWSLGRARTGIIEVAQPGAPELAGHAREGFEPPARAWVLPVARPGSEQPAGLLVAGINSARPADDSARGFAALIADHVSAAVADAVAFEAERHRAEQLAALDRAKTMFFSNISHEFRTPLTLLLGPVEDLLAEREALSEGGRERAELIHSNALRLLKLVNTLLDFSRAEAGRMTPRLEPLDLAALTAELASLFEVAVERGGLRLVTDCPPLPRPVPVDPDMWEKIILNLLSNAFKFTLDGEIRVRLEAVGEEVRLEVADTGVGIPAEELPRLFDRFHRVPGSGGRSEEGSGIGLSLVRELVHLHGGTVEVASEPGRGSTFTVRLPYRTEEAEAGGLAHGTAEPEAGGLPGRSGETDGLPDRAERDPRTAGAHLREALGWAAGGEQAAAGGPEVLVVDDNADMRAYLQRVLAPHWRVRAVADGRAALAAVEADPPELVLTDVMMPGVDGFGLLEALRADERTRHLPVIMISARAGQESAIEGLHAGADDYLIKPFTTAELIARVRTHLSTARQQREAAEHLTALAEVSRRLNASLDPAEISRVLCAEIVPAFAAGCAVWLHTEAEENEGHLAPVLQATRAADPLPAEALHRPPGELGPDEVVELRHRGRVIGLAVLAGPTPAATHPARRPFLDELVGRAALALDNAAQYDRQHRIAVHLQRSLLPQALPEMAPVRLAARYRPGSAGQQASGDWYDALELPDGRIALTIGDVMGRGVRAAALMGQLRTAIQAYSLEGLPAAPLLERVNQFLHAGGQRQFTTLCYAIYDPDTHALQLANAGHLPPLLVPRDGPARLLPVHHGLALGVDPGFPYRGQTFAVPPGATLLLYTDGLVENRTQPLAERMAELCRTLSGHGGDPEGLCALAMRSMTGTDPRDDLPTAGTGSGTGWGTASGTGSGDDIALLAMHRRTDG
ncbi:SpoIIE family protein phosphatase [Nonomuraea sp. NPDC050310]|uniref:SpoIIE family protein phosphatase n=1 Tax=Nonomuraea sp. NPDC050310 TaxID=3154935 RepID=UPI0033CE0801